MDPLSISASALTVIAAAITTVKTLHETVIRYKGRDKTLARLSGGLLDLVSILNSLEAVANEETPILTLLKSPVKRCGQVCREFEETMNVFSGKSKTGLRDWTKMEFMRGDINEFIDTLSDYKSTITIGLGTITMHASLVTKKVVEEYSEMIQDTTYNLDMRLQRIDERLRTIDASRLNFSGNSSIDLQNEKAMTVECLHICERASSYLISLQEGQPALQIEAMPQASGYISRQFEAQLLTQKSMNESRDNLLETISRLRERLELLTSGDRPSSESETTQLREEAKFSNECLRVCQEVSSQVSSQKIHIIGEVTAEEDCDQVVVTTLADLFNVGKVGAKKGSSQIVGSMEGDVLRVLSNDRYSSRSATTGRPPENADAKPNTTTASSSASTKPQKADDSHQRSSQARELGRSAGSGVTIDRPSSNEVRRRKAGDEDVPQKSGQR